MRLRILASVVAVLTGALLLAGALSYSLVHQASLSSARADALREALAVAKHPDVAKKAGVYTLLQDTSQGRFQPVIVRANGTFVGAGPPAPIPQRLRDGKRLESGHAISGVTGTVAYAIAPMQHISAGTLGLGPGYAVTLAIADERPVTDAFASIDYFLLAGGISLVVAGLVIGVISRRISRRVLAASAAARQIASGDLNVRVERDNHAYPELAGLDDAIDTMAANLARARDQERQFLLSISHDLRTPLTSIRGYAEAIKEGAAADPHDAAAVVVAEATRLERLIRDLLDLARLQAHQFSLKAVPCDLVDIVSDIVEAQRLAHQAVGVSLELTLVSGPVPVVADADRVAQIIANLIDNALKFARSEVHVHLERNDAGARISVENDGPAISEDDLQRVFERHFTSSRAAARAGGSGLGLAIVAELVAAMGGRRSVVSPVTPEGGARFVIELPRSPADGLRRDARVETPAPSSARAPAPLGATES